MTKVSNFSFISTIAFCDVPRGFSANKRLTQLVDRRLWAVGTFQSMRCKLFMYINVDVIYALKLFKDTEIPRGVGCLVYVDRWLFRKGSLDI